jgi:proteasome lid subunit RPN8/RPN11
MNDDIPEIPASLLHTVYNDAQRCYPEEACGLLIGPRAGAHCDEARPCENQQNRLHEADPESHPRDARTAYALGVRDLRLLDASLGSDRPVKVIYHSHVDVGAYFSDEDRRAATYDGELIYPVDYLVVDCAKEGVRGAKLFRFRAGAFFAVAEYPPLVPAKE